MLVVRHALLLFDPTDERVAQTSLRCLLDPNTVNFLDCAGRTLLRLAMAFGTVLPKNLESGKAAEMSLMRLVCILYADGCHNPLHQHLT